MNMKKISESIVERRVIILITMIVIAIALALLSLKVVVNTDMAKYLPDDSEMKTGIGIMEQEFPEAEDAGDIRVMFTDLEESQKPVILESLETIEYANDVEYEKDSPDFNNGNHTLYIVNFNYGYETDEAASVERAIAEGFSDYDMVYHVDYDSSALPLPVILVAFALLMAVLFFMCGSWLEPILLIVTIGIAILMNMGSNLIFGTIAETTYSIAAILQLVLSIDYSMILVNRYRQERALTGGEPKAIMKRALANSFAAITSSAIATIVGLLALCFMSFKLGMDLGLVLSKGVFLSMICVITVLPSLLVICDKGIKRTAKRTLPLTMGALGKFSDKFRFVTTGAFALIFIGAMLLSNNTQFAFVLAGADPTEEYFPKSSTVVVVYDNDDEGAAADLANRYADNPQIKDVQSYASTIGKEYTAQELADEMSGADNDNSLDLDASLLNILYYNYFKGDECRTVTAGEFIDFVANDVMNNEAFADKFGDDITENIEDMRRFANPSDLTRKMSANEIADFFELDSNDVIQLLLYYYTEYGGAPTGTMTLPVFTNFIANDVATNKDYSSMLDAESLSMIDQLKRFTDKDGVTRSLTTTELAQALSMDESMVKQLLTYYYATKKGYNPGEMTVQNFVSFLTKDVASNDMFASYFDAETKKQMETLAGYTNPEKIQKPLTRKELAVAFGMDESMVDGIFTIVAIDSAPAIEAMSLKDFVDLLCSLMTNDQYASMFDDAMKAQLLFLQNILANTNTQMTSVEISATFAMEQTMADQVFMMASAVSGNAVDTMSPKEFVAFLCTNVLPNDQYAAGFSEDMKTQLLFLQNILVSADTNMTSSEISTTLGIDSNMVEQVFAMASAMGAPPIEKLSMKEFIDFLCEKVLPDEQYAPMFDKETKSGLLFIKGLMDASISGKAYSYTEMAKLIGMDSDMMKMLYTYHVAMHGDTHAWKLSLQSVINFIVDDLSKNEGFSSMFDKGTLQQLRMLQLLINGTVDGMAYTAGQLASLLEMNAGDVEGLYLLYISKHGDTSGWNMSVQEFVHFLIDDVLSDETLSDQFDAQSASDLTMARTIINAVVSETPYTSNELAAIFADFSNEMDANTMDLMYLYYYSTFASDPAWKLSIDEVFGFLTGTIFNDPRFDAFIDSMTRSDILDIKKELDDGLKQLVGPRYSRMILTVALQEGSDEMTRLIDSLSSEFDSVFGKDFYLIGNSPMVYEMSRTFNDELDFVTLLTAAAIFLVVALAFRALLIPLILVLIIQGGVFLTICLTGLQESNMYYLALLVVQCILMGATIDWGILFASYYRETRPGLSRREALTAAYNGSIHTILTSSLVVILVTGSVGFLFENPTIGQICLTIAKGALCAAVLIIFVLPGVVAAFDKLINRRKKVAISSSV
jgi:predicted RND superfamily exporter protein